MTLKQFQIEDLARAALHDSAILAWEQGLGKSLAAIVWAIIKGARRTLIIAPGSLHHQLTLSAATFFQKSLRPLNTLDDFYARALHHPHPKNAPPQFFITSYQAIGLNGADEWSPTFGHKGEPSINKLLAKRRRAWCLENHRRYTLDIAQSVGETRAGITCVWTPTLARVAAMHDSFDCVVIDEGTRLQATESRIAASIRLLDPKYRLVLTGTPIKNRLESLFWLASWVAGRYGRWPYAPNESSRERFAGTFLQNERFITREENARLRGEKPRNTTKRSNRICSVHRLWKTLAPVIIRRRKADCGEEIPNKTVQPIIVSPGQAQLAVYRYHLDNPPLRGKTGGKAVHRRVQIGMQLTMLRLAALCPQSQSLQDSFTGAAGPRRSWTDITPKLAAVLGIIKEVVGAGKQVIVGSPFREFSQALQARLEEAEVASVLLDGDVAPEDRGRLAHAFKKGKYAVLVAGLKAMGEGHSFENCSHLILPGLSYAYDENEQFIHRIWRLNSPGPVTIYPVIMQGSIDEKLHEIFTEKADAANLALDGRLFTEPTADVDLEWLLNQTIRSFDPKIPTISEQQLLDQWDATTARQLRHAYQQYLEHSVVGEANPEDLAAAVSALKIPSPTQLSVDMCRKHFKSGTFKKPTAESLAAATKKAAYIRKRK